MVICVFGSASDEIADLYKERTQALCSAAARRGHSLVYGAGAAGLMGAAARGFAAEGGRVLGVIPEFFKEERIEEINFDCDEIIYTASMQERKRIMEEKADAFLVTPGGVGTFEEFLEVLTLKQLDRHKKPIALYNIDGYYNPLIVALERGIERGFIHDTLHARFRVFTEDGPLLDYLEAPQE